MNKNEMKVYATLNKETFANATNEVKSVFTNVFAVAKMLEKVAKGDATKDIEGLSVANIKVVANALKSMHNQRNAFDVPQLAKLSDGKYIVENGVLHVRTRSKSCPVFGIDLLDVNEKGWSYYKPVNATYISVFNAFKSLCKIYQKDLSKKAKELDAFTKAKKACELAYGRELTKTFADAEIMEKYALLKGIK